MVNNFILFCQKQVSKFGKKDLPSMLITILCVVCYGKDYSFVYTEISTIDSLLYSFCHANIFHLSINLIALWQFRPRWFTVSVAYYITFAIVPFVSVLNVPTCGLSVLLFACYARYYVSWKKSVIRIIIMNSMLLALNMLFSTTYFNVIAHAVAFFVGYIFWTIYYKAKLIWKEEN